MSFPLDTPDEVERENRHYTSHDHGYLVGDNPEDFVIYLA